MDLIQMQRLVAFSLKGSASKWYRSQYSEERLTLSWGEFIKRFDLHFISSTVRAEKEAELLALKQGDISVTV